MASEIHRFAASGRIESDPLKIQVARASLRKLHVAHGLERHADQQAQMAALGPEEHLHGDVVRDVMSR